MKSKGALFATLAFAPHQSYAESKRDARMKVGSESFLWPSYSLEDLTGMLWSVRFGLARNTRANIC